MSFEDQNNNVIQSGDFADRSTSNSDKNMSGRGSGYPVPDVVANRFNWGAFLLTWIWGLGNSTYITLLFFVTILFGFIPLIGGLISLGVCIWFGIKGNEWAWQNKHFDSVQAFHDYQKKWAIAGVICQSVLILLGIIGAVVSLMLPSLLTNSSAEAVKMHRLKAATSVLKVVSMNELDENKCKLSSTGLAKCFEKQMIGTRERNVINVSDGSVWTFKGNGICKNEGDCKITIKFNIGDTTDIGEIPLYVNSKGYIDVNKSDIDKFKN